jgi:beta-glucanase (GH16 family)/regulation of enolase protein 1 (concanavalin A-like superfamily)
MTRKHPFGPQHEPLERRALPTWFRRKRRRWPARFVPALLALEDRLVLSPPGGGWQLAWSDEFNGTSLDTSKWKVDTGARRDAVNTADAVSEGGGSLTITTYTSGGTNYTGFIGTPLTFLGTYGYWEARVDFQDSPGEWSAFWLESPTIGNPLGNPALAGTEIDVVEHRYTDGTSNISNKGDSNLHWDGYGPSERSAGSGLVNNPGSTPLQGNFHLYGLQWGPTGYQFFIDGTQVWSSTQGVSQRSEYIYLTSEVQNHSWAGNIPSGGYGSLATGQTKMIVDYVRVYEQVPSDWASTDIGNPGILGSASFLTAAGTWTVAGSGADIWGTADQFHFASESVPGDGSLTAQVLSVQNTNAWAKAGVMFRDSADPGAPFADVLATPANGVAFEWRPSPGAQAQDVHVPGLSAPVWVQLVRAGNAFSAAYSTDGATWAPIGTPQTVAMSTTALAGLAVTSHNVNASTSAAFSHVSVLPASWTAGDVGAPGLAGSSVLDPAAGAWTVSGGGADIWGTADQFQFASQGLTGDGSLTAQVLSVQNTDPWAKAGVMFRDSTNASAPFADVVVTPGQGVSFQWRGATGGSPTSVTVPGVTAPAWVRLVRAGNTFTGSYSTDGVTWAQIGATQTVALSTTALAGLAVTAHNNALLSTATFGNVSLTAPVDLSGAYNQIGLVNDGTPFAGGGLDGNGDAYSANLLGSSVTAGGLTFNLGAAGGNSAVQAQGQTIALPAGAFSALTFLATAVNGAQLAQTFTVTYTDGTSDTFTQDLSDWQGPQGFVGEAVTAALGYYDAADGSSPGAPNYLYQYTFNLNSQKAVSSITLANNPNVVILAIDLIR